MRILILTQKIETISLLFNGETPHEYRLCTSLEQLSKALEVFVPEMIVLGEDQQKEDTATLLTEIRNQIAPRTYLVCITHKNTLPELCTRMSADALLHPNDQPEQVEELLRACQEWQPFISQSLLPSGPSPVRLKSLLSTRERQILDQIAKGWTAKKIAEQLHLSSFTVKNHRKNIKKKLGLAGSPIKLHQLLKLCEIIQLRNP
jgi:two-component system nitrate/nitrite response regulator NarL